MNAQKTCLSILIALTAMVLPAHASELASAKVTAITGSVTLYTAGGQDVPLSIGQILKEGDSISVTALSQVKLVFSNGSELTVEENSSVRLTTLRQEAFAGNQAYEQLEADPSKSQTLLKLDYGELRGHVKKLQKGSKFFIQTPLGTAAIRGTKFTVKFSYNALRGEFKLTVNNIDGLVDIITNHIAQLALEENLGDKFDDSGTSAGTPVPIPSNDSITIRIDKSDPNFDTILNTIQDIIPQGLDTIVVTPGGIDGNDGGDDDFPIQVVSPDGPQQ